MKVFKYLFDKKYRFFVNAKFGLLRRMNDKRFLEKMFYYKTGKKLDLKNPTTFNEKMQWLKLYHRLPVFTSMADKYEVKEYVKNKIGDSYVAKSYGVWDSFDQISFEQLPNSFVLKTTHDCGGIYVCKNKDSLDIKKCKSFIEKHMKRRYFYQCREWPYKNIKPRILAEEYLQDGDREFLPVYKIFTFNGVPTIIQVIQNDKKPNETIDYYDTEWKKLKLKQNYPNSLVQLDRPLCLDAMLEVAKKLSSNLPFVRVDLYVVNGAIYFSEYTFYSDAGFENFYPNEWDDNLGKLIILPNDGLNYKKVAE